MSISVIGVVGAGFMGSGIAQSAATSGKHVLLYEPEEAPLARAQGQLAAALQRSVDKGRISETRPTSPTGSCTRASWLPPAGADAVIEAITEDKGMQLGCGHPMGPLPPCDFIGLDVLYAVCESLYEEFKRPEYAPPPLLKRMVVSGHHGRKTGRGFFEYAPARAVVGAL
jgi:3-hydroxyacyl-CoA dehydrogenase